MNKSLSITLIALSLHSCTFGMKEETNRDRTQKAQGVIATVQAQLDKEAAKKRREDARIAAMYKEAEPVSFVAPQKTAQTPYLQAPYAKEELDAPIDRFTSPRHHTPEARFARDAIEHEYFITELTIKSEEFQERLRFTGRGTCIDLTESKDTDPRWAEYHQASADYYSYEDDMFNKLDKGRPKTTFR